MTCCRGFTLLELMVTVAVAAILITVAVPAYQGMVQRNTMTSMVNSLVGAINYARSEAITRGTPVKICASGDQNSCSGTWLQGWIVKDGNDLLRVHGAVTVPNITVTEDINGPVKFGGSGFTRNGSSTIKFASTTSQDNTCIIISTSGRVTTEAAYYGSNPDSCCSNPGSC